MPDITSLTSKDILTDLLSGITISILLIPEAIAFALLLGLPPSTGIQSTMILSLIGSIFGGQPGLISGASAAVATSIAGVTAAAGKEYIPLTVVIGGLLQAIIGFTGLYKLINIMPNGVVSGFMCGLALLIVYSEINSFKTSDGKWFTNDLLAYSVLLTIIGLTIVIYGDIKAYVKIPGALSSIIVLSLSLILLPAIKVMRVQDVGKVQTLFPSFSVPKMDWASALKVLPYSIAMAVAGTTESLFNLRRVGEELKSKGDSFQETMTQSIGNILCGFTNGMGGCVLGGPTRFNIANGAKSRVSTISAAVFFILFSSVFFKFIDTIPMPAIIAIMFVVAYKTGDWTKLFAVPDKTWIATSSTTLSTYVTGNLAFGVFFGSFIDILLQKYF
jgi:SulP family sulfate permease